MRILPKQLTNLQICLSIKMQNCFTQKICQLQRILKVFHIFNNAEFSLYLLILFSKHRNLYQQSYSMKLDSQILNDTVIMQKYDLLQKLGEGCFGKIYKVKNKQLNYYTALKIQILQKNSKKTMLENEAQLLQLVQDKPYVPKFYNYGQWTLGTYIQIQLLEKDLNSLADQAFSMDEITLLTVKLMQSLSVLHNSNIIHQDIKPQNIMINSKGEYVFIDYGISKKLNSKAITPQNQQKRTKGFIGTPRYASIAAHKGLQQTKKDDLQSLMYNIAFLYFKKLPWLSLRVPGNRKIEEIRIMKHKTADDIFQQMGKSFFLAFSYIKKLKPIEEPNYKYLFSLFKRNNTMIVDTFTPRNFQAAKKLNQEVSIMRSSEKKYSLNPNQNYGKYLNLPVMGKQGFVDNVMTLDRPYGDSNMNSVNSSGSRGFSIRAYHEVDYVTDDEYGSFERDLNIDVQQDQQPPVINIAKFCSPLLLKNPFSNKD